MKKTALVILAAIFFVQFASAVIVTEFESNPVGGADGTEWIEIYNDLEDGVDISNWEIWEGISGSSGSKKILAIENGTVLQPDNFYIIELSSAKLNNDGDFVILYDSNASKVDETDKLKDAASGTKTWQLCDGEWVFLEETKNAENECPAEEAPLTGDNTTENEEAGQNNEEEQNSNNNEEPIVKIEAKANITLENIELQPIELKSGENSQVSDSKDKNNLALYGLFAFAILLGFLFLAKELITKRRKEKLV